MEQASHLQRKDTAALPTDWDKSSYSNPSGNCIEYGITSSVAGPDVVFVRDSKEVVADASGEVLAFSPQAWGSFVGAIAAGEFRP